MLDYLKQSDYTGSNRCYPCTISNLAILIAVAIFTTLKSAQLSILFMMVGSAAIWLRGYVVPFTPRIGSLLKNKIHNSIRGKQRSETGDGSLAAGNSHEEAIIEELLQEDILESRNSENLVLSDTFEERWRLKIEEMRLLDCNEFEQWATSLLSDHDCTSVEVKDQYWAKPYIIASFESGKEPILQYPAAIAEITSIAVMENMGVKKSVQLHASGALRGFITKCPICDTELEVSTYSGCCGNPRNRNEKPGLVCKPCQTVIYKF